MLSPKGAGFLYARPQVQDRIEPLVVSWGYHSTPQTTSGSRFLDYLAYGGYSLVVIDEPVWRLVHFQGLPVAQAAADAAAAVNPVIAAARAAAPGVRFQVVEPFKELLWAYLAAGGQADYVAGEDYGPPHPGDVRLADLYAMRDAYGVGVQQWTLGVEKAMEYEHRVELVIAADIHGTWHLMGDYSEALRTALAQTCRIYLPVVAR